MGMSSSNHEAEPQAAVPALSYVDGPSVDSQEAWDSLNTGLPEMLGKLLTAEPFNAVNPPDRRGRSIYLFSEGSHHLYVGRTSITACSRKAGREQQAGSGSPPNSAPFAMKLARECAERFGVASPLQAATRFIRETLDLRTIEISDDVRGVRSHVAEVYADVILQTTYGDFSTS
jgi:hypothetical protein